MSVFMMFAPLTLMFLRVHLAHSEGRKIVLSVVAKRWVACSIILNSDCYLRDAKALPEGLVEWRVFTSGVEALNSMITRLRKAGCEVELVKNRRSESADILTRRQRLVVQKAIEFGYFDYPRRITACALAKKVNISPPTLAEILRSAEKKMSEFYLRKG